MEITVTIKNVYGEQKIYPVCPMATGFCKLLNQKTLTEVNIRDIRAMGFTVNVKQPLVTIAA